jgi:hypothetical protein
MFLWRQSTLSDESVQQSQANWNQWRSKAAEDDGKKSPVLRTVPKSVEPPAVVLMRDYFPACVLGTIVPISGLYVFIAWLVCGVLRQGNGNNGSKEVSGE